MAQNKNFFKIPAWDWELVGLLYQFGKSDGSKWKKKSEDYAFLHTFLYGGYRK